MGPHATAASRSPSVTSGLAGHAAQTPAATLQRLWIAVGVLGLGVVALGATLVVQSAGPSVTPVARPTFAAQPAEFGSNQAPALTGQAYSAINLVDNAAVPSGSSATAPGYQPLQPLHAAPSTAPAPAPAPVPVQAALPAPAAAPPLAVQAAAAPPPRPVCGHCGQVESVRAVQQAAPATGVGAVAGGVLGAVVGNQVGKGSGRAAATVLGAVGGGYVGHKVEERTRTRTVYQVAIRMDDGSLRRFTRTQPPAAGTPVVLQGKGFRVDDGRTARGQSAPPPGAVRVADGY